MACSVSIKKNMGSFSLDMHFQTEAKRLGILGESGAGKSMCLKAIAGILKPDEGDLHRRELCIFQGKKAESSAAKEEGGLSFSVLRAFPAYERLGEPFRGS